MQHQVTLIRYSGTRLKHKRMAKVFKTLLTPAIEKGWRVCLVLSEPPEDPSWLDDLHALGVQFEFLPRPKGNFDLGCIMRAKALCEKYRCDIFHCDNMHTSPMIGAWLARVPVRVWQKRSMTAAYEAGRELSLRDRIAPSIRSTCLLATRVVTVSKAVRDELVALGMPGKKIEVRINPFDINELERPKGRKLVRQELGYEEDDLVVMTVGHAVPVKRWDLLIEAFHGALERGAEGKLLLVGGTSTTQEERSFFPGLKKLIKRLGIEDRVKFTGHVGNVGEILDAGDLFVLPSMSEGCANALLEALGKGLPCIATRVGAAEDVIEDGVSGLLVDRNDLDQLTYAIFRMMSDCGLRENIKNNSKLPDIIKTRKEYAVAFADMYEDLLRKSRRGHVLSREL